MRILFNRFCNKNVFTLLKVLKHFFKKILLREKSIEDDENVINLSIYSIEIQNTTTHLLNLLGFDCNTNKKITFKNIKNKKNMQFVLDKMVKYENDLYKNSSNDWKILWKCFIKIWEKEWNNIPKKVIGVKDHICDANNIFNCGAVKRIKFFLDIFHTFLKFRENYQINENNNDGNLCLSDILQNFLCVNRIKSLSLIRGDYHHIGLFCHSKCKNDQITVRNYMSSINSYPYQCNWKNCQHVKRLANGPKFDFSNEIEETSAINLLDEIHVNLIHFNIHRRYFKRFR